MLVPKIVKTLQEYSPKQFYKDFSAGIIVGIVALPLAIAFAIASGVPPEKGLYTAIIAGFIISLLGGSRVQIGGPTGAFVVIVSSIIAQYGINGLTIATLMACVFHFDGAVQTGRTHQIYPLSYHHRIHYGNCRHNIQLPDK